MNLTSEQARNLQVWWKKILSEQCMLLTRDLRVEGKRRDLVLRKNDYELHLRMYLRRYLHSLCFKSNTVKKRLVSHFENFLVVA